jgi:hypothetical protein
MDPIATLVNQFGLILGLTVSLYSLIVWVIRKRVETKSHIETTDANTRSQVAVSEAASSHDLTQAILALASAVAKSSEQAGIERTKTFEHLERMTGRIEGMATAQLGYTRASDVLKNVVDEFGNRLDEFGGRIRDIPQIGTDLKGLLERAGKIPDEFSKALAPLVALMIKHGADVQILLQNQNTMIALLESIAHLGAEGTTHEDPVPTEAD